MKETFNASADGTYRKPENRPDPAKIAERGIKTPESLSYLASQHPAPPKASYEINQEAARQAALDFVRAQQRAEVNVMRERFAQTPEKARRDFGTARDYRGEQRER